MIELHLPWLELSVLIPMVGAIVVCRLRESERAQKWCVVFCSLALASAVGAWEDFATLQVKEAHDIWDMLTPILGTDFLVIDEFNAPLLPLAALLYLVTAVATLRTKVRRFSFSWTLISESILLATLSCRQPWGIIVLMALATIPPWLELRARHKPTRVYTLHMSLFIGLLASGWALVAGAGETPELFILGILLLGAGIFVRSGIVPVHCWMTDLFEHATFGTALLFVIPMVGAYAAVRLVVPIAPEWALRSIAFVALFTSVYAAGMALVQREARRFFCYLFLSHSALVLVGLEMVRNPIGLTGGLCVWLSVGLALAGFGLTLRSMEARVGRIALTRFHGLYDHTTILAAFFLLTGLASVGFPGTIGFIATELLVEGAVESYAFVGMAVVFAAALNGIAVLQVYFRLFTGTRHTASISLRIRMPEWFAVLTLTTLIIGGGLFPQAGVTSRYLAALGIVKSRSAHVPPQPVHEQKEHRTAFWAF